MSKWLAGNILKWKRWVSCELVKDIRNRKDKELVVCMIASGKVKKVRVQLESSEKSYGFQH